MNTNMNTNTNLIKNNEKATASSQGVEKETVIEFLNEALATELVCVLRYKRHYEMASGIDSKPIAEEFLEHAMEEQDHADRLSRRIAQLGGAPDLDPDHLTDNSHTRYVECRTVDEMLKENLAAERIAISTYTAMIQKLGDSDPTSRRLLESILEVEEEHADDLIKFMD